MKIGERIKELRKKQGITQEQLAENLGISFQAVSKWENEVALPDITLVPAIASFFRVTTDYLFDYTIPSDSAIEMQVVRPQKYEDANEIIEYLQQYTVVINFEDVDKETAKQIKDKITRNVSDVSMTYISPNPSDESVVCTRPPIEVATRIVTPSYVISSDK